jgi:hypothetical protein
MGKVKFSCNIHFRYGMVVIMAYFHSEERVDLVGPSVR